MQDEFSQPDYRRTLLYQSTLCMLWVAYITAIGYGVDEAVWINVVETPIPYHVGGRRGRKKPPRTRIQRSNGWESIFASTFCQTPMGGWIQKSSKVLGLATGRIRTLTSTQSCACNGLPPQSLLMKTFALVRRWKWKVLLIPSKVSGVLQPLDAWVFAA